MDNKLDSSTISLAEVEFCIVSDGEDSLEYVHLRIQLEKAEEMASTVSGSRSQESDQWRADTDESHEPIIETT